MAATRCFEAVKEGNLAQLQAIVEEENRAGNDVVNALNEEGSSLLHVATVRRHLAIVKWILSDESGGFKMILAKDKLGRTVLHIAVENQDLEECREIALAAKSENWERDDLLSARDSNGFGILHLAAFHGATSIITWILSDEGGRRVGFCNVLGKDKTGKGVLQIAMEQNHLESCVALLEGSKVENGERVSLVNSVDRNRWTILHTAAASNIAPSAVAWILSDEGGRGAGFSDVLGKSDCGETALHLATERGDLETCQAIVDGCKVENGERAELLNAVDRYHRTVLHLAVIRQHLPIVEWLLSDDGGRSAGFNQVLAKSSNQLTAFHEAAKTGSVDMCKALAKGSKIENGERLDLLNSVDRDGRTALHIAAERGNIPLISWLLSEDEGRAFGFDFSAKDNNGETALHIAARNGDIPLISFLLSDNIQGMRAGEFDILFSKDKNTRTALHIAVEHGHLEACQVLINSCCIENGERSLLLSAQDKSRWTILHVAAFSGSKIVISWLLSDDGGRLSGLTSQNIRARSNDGKTALHIAADTGDLEVCQAIAYGSQVENGERAELLNAVDICLQTVLHHAVSYRHLPLVEWLLSDDGGRSAGFNQVLAKSSNQLTAFHEAAKTGSVAICKALANGSKVENGERLDLLNSVDKEGRTALHIAAERGDIPLISWLLSDEEDGGRTLGFHSVLRKVNDGRTVMHYAAMQGSLEAFQALIHWTNAENGERVELLNAVDGDSMTALQCAIFSGRSSIISWLLSYTARGMGFTNVANRAKNGETVLHLAVMYGHFDVVISGLQNGEREELLNATDNDGWNVLHSAVFRTSVTTVIWLLSKEGGRASGFRSESISALTKKNSYSALHLAAGRYSYRPVFDLLSNCTPVERMNLFLRVDNNGATAIHAAARERCSQPLEELLRHPESQLIVDARDNEGMTALHRTILQSAGIGLQPISTWAGVENIVKILLGFRDSDSKKQQQSEDSSVLVVADLNAGVKI